MTITDVINKWKKQRYKEYGWDYENDKAINHSTNDDILYWLAEKEVNKISSSAVLAVSLPLEEMLNELPDNRPLYHDSGSWQIRSDNMEDVLYQQATNESFYNFIKRCYEKENKLMDLGQ